MGWVGVYAVVGVIDLIQWALDFTGVGEIINEAIDIPIGFGIAYFFSMKGIKMTSPGRLLGIGAAFVAEELTFSVIPAWIIDVAFTHYTVISEDKKTKASIQQNASQSQNGPLNQGKVRKPTNGRTPPLNSNNKRSPIKVKI